MRRAWFVLGVLATITAVGATVLWIRGEVPSGAVYGAVISTAVWWGAGIVGMDKLLGVSASSDLGDSSPDA